jgi:hypothetical protein
MKKCYRIKNWADHFENNRTRTMRVMQWIPVPNKHDGDGYTELVDHENGAAHLGAWLAILQVASKCGQRGTLLRDNGTPHTPRTISRQTRLPESIIEDALARLCSDDIEWLEVVDYKDDAGTPHKSAPSAHVTDEEEKGMERKGMEGKQQHAEGVPKKPSQKELYLAYQNDKALVWSWLLSSCEQLNEKNFSLETFIRIEQCFKYAPAWLAVQKIADAMTTAIIDNPRRVSGYVRSIWADIDLQEGKKGGSK